MASTRIPLDLWAFGYASAVIEVRAANSTALAAIYSDELLTTPADNPVTLISFFDADGNGYGKFEVPLYCGVPFELHVNSTDQSGVFRPPLTSLDGVDASNALAKPPSSNYLRPITDHVGKEIHAADYGQFTDLADSNTEIIVTAVGQAAAFGGGYVILPPGNIEITTLTLPAGVHLKGQGEDVTTLISSDADRIITIGGNDAGLEHLTLDGVVLIANSVGVYADNKAIWLERVKLKRFETGLHIRGGVGNAWHALSVDNCQVGAKLMGDVNLGGGSTGGPLVYLRWTGGVVSTCIQQGIWIGYVDELCSNIGVHGVMFDANLATALQIEGAQFVSVLQCNFTENDIALDVFDAAPPEIDESNLVKNIDMRQCRVSSTILGGIVFSDTCQDVVLRNCDFINQAFVMNLPVNQILQLNCTNDSATVVTGDSTKLTTRADTDSGQTIGVTTDATATKTWSTGTLEPGQMVMLDVSFIANGRNTNTKAKYRRIGTFRKPSSTLAYDAQTANFTAGLVITGFTSGATARIVADADAGTTGTLTLRDIVGTFLDNELITDSATGSALANGTVTSGGSVAVFGAVETIGTDQEDTAGWDVSLTAVVDEVEARVTGAASTTIEWTVAFTMIKD